MVAGIVVDCKAINVNKPFNYLVPSSFETTIKIGLRVKVPFGKRSLLGIVVSLEEKEEANLKEIDELLDLTPCLTEELIKLAYNMHEYYFSLYITCLQTMIPSALRARYQKEFIALNYDGLSQNIKPLFVNNKYSFKKNDSSLLPILLMEVKNGNLALNTHINNKENIKMLKYVYAIKNDASLNNTQKDIWCYVADRKEVSKSYLVEKYGSSRIQTLLKKGVLVEKEKEVYRAFDQDRIYNEKKINLTLEQQNAYEQIKASYGKNETFLLHGVTGSGKTEIYLKVIEDMVSIGKEAILLVPEISLTPQIVARFKARFKDDVALIHSSLSTGEKYDEWRKIIRKEVHIAIGARSAIFAPFENLGVIIVDEEHEQSYLQEKMPKYDARVIARIRAKNHQAITILGSATPSIESYYKALNKQYKLITLAKRVNDKPLPSIKAIDMGDEFKSGNHSIFSRALKASLEECLSRGEQAILLMNRRGFSSFVMCRECGEVIKCPHCDVSLTYHKSANILMCHYCGYKQKMVEACPKCKSKRVRMVGGGTEKVVEELNRLLPAARVLRMDNDTTSTKGSHEKIISAFANHEADVLVGTQMVAKGLNFPLCSLVGILNADLALKYPNYNSSFAAFSLFTQVAGRAGRCKTGGYVIMQAYDKAHYVIRNAIANNYRRFYEEELRYRRLGGYPPFSKMILIKVSGNDYYKSYDEALKIVNELKKINNVQVLGPAEDFVVKVKDKYNFIVTIKVIDEKILRQYLTTLYIRYQNMREYSIIISRM